MTPVGGSRHYSGGGLGEVGLWACPSCGEDNTGKLEAGCVHCGAGKPGTRPAAPAAPPPPPAPPRVSEREPDDPTYQVKQGDVADWWADQHPEATVADAYRAGLAEGMRAARAAAPVTVVGSFPPDRDQRITRTIIAALTHFRDQVLLDATDEIAAGEWSSVEEITAVIADITTTLSEVPHA